MKLLQPAIRVANAAGLRKLTSSAMTLLVLLGGCASYSGYGLKPGVATGPDVRQAMGEPAARWSTPAGDVWAYPRGPLGSETFLVRFDENGRLSLIEQVLNDDHFGRIHAGMTGEDVLHLIGPPFQTTTYSGTRQTSWDYHYRDDSAQSALFSVIFSDAGVVVGTLKQRLSGNGHNQ
ncbi:MAG TPA: hypothetical protein VEG37_11690 [Burkholderiales bacterium]|nr:hypothetical protein [Burkholderiales bacterium]